MNTIAIEVFKTNVEEFVHAETIRMQLLNHFPASRITFDLEDCDKVLRIEGPSICCKTVNTVLSDNGFSCQTLD